MTRNINGLPTAFLDKRALASSSNSHHSDDHIFFAGINISGVRGESTDRGRRTIGL